MKPNTTWQFWVVVFIILVVLAAIQSRTAGLAVALGGLVAYEMAKVERFTDLSTILPGAPVPNIQVPRRDPGAPPAYPGAVDLSPLGGDLADGATQALPDGGTVRNESRDAPVEWDPNAVASNGPLNFDERIARNQLGRNDPTRPVEGEMRRRRMMSKYLSEEVAAREADEWWGVHEY